MFNQCQDSALHFIFDLDGTLVNSESVMRIAWDRCCLDYGLITPFEDYKRHLGRPFFEILDHLNLGLYGKKDSLYLSIKNTYINESLKNIEQVVFWPGALDFISDVETAGIPWSIVTSRSRATTTRIINQANLEPRFLHCDDDDSISKPNPLIINRIFSAANGVDKMPKLYYFGDMLVDLIFAVNSGMTYIHCDFGSYGPLPSGVFPAVQSIKNWASAKQLLALDVQDNDLADSSQGT